MATTINKMEDKSKLLFIVFVYTHDWESGKLPAYNNNSSFEYTQRAYKV